MTADQFAITSSGYRAITPSMQLATGETRVTEIPAALLTKIKGDQMNIQRNQLLRGCDWTQADDSPLSAPQQTAWAVYRQQLRDLPALPGFPDVPWPLPPTLGGAAGGVGPIEL